MRGIIVPSLTVFRPDESVDEDATARHIDWLIGEGADGIVPCGSSGEFPALTTDETTRLIDVAVQAARRRVPVYAAIGRYATRDTIALGRHAARAGADGVMVVLPYYMLPDRRSVLEHFRSVRRAVDLPIILYNNPWTCGYELSAAEIAELAAEQIVDAVKASHGDPFRIDELKQLCGERVRALYGHDFAPLGAFLAGADGWLTGVLNVLPRAAKELWQAGDRAGALWPRWRPFIHTLMCDKTGGHPHLVAVYKAALAVLGHDVGEPRRPLLPATAEQRRRIEIALRQVQP